MMGQLWAISWESIRNQVKTLTNPIARAEPWTHMGSPRQFLGHLATSSALPAWKQTDRCVVKIFRNWVSWLYIVYWVRHILLKHTLKKPFNHWIVVGFHGLKTTSNTPKCQPAFSNLFLVQCWTSKCRILLNSLAPAAVLWWFQNEFSYRMVPPSHKLV